MSLKYSIHKADCNETK